LLVGITSLGASLPPGILALHDIRNSLVPSSIFVALRLGQFHAAAELRFADPFVFDLLVICAGGEMTPLKTFIDFLVPLRASEWHVHVRRRVLK
jgi:hypothetical protein